MSDDQRTPPGRPVARRPDLDLVWTAAAEVPDLAASARIALDELTPEQEP